MMYFLFGIVFGWLIGLTCFQFRREIPAPTPEMWTLDDLVIQPSTKSGTIGGTAEFLNPDRVGEIIKGKKEDVRLDDILI